MPQIGSPISTWTKPSSLSLLLFNNYYFSSPWGHEGERNNYYCFSKIQLVGQKNTGTKHLLLVKARRPKHYKYGRHFSLLVNYNIWPSTGSTNQNAALIIDHWLDFTKIIYCCQCAFYINIVIRFYFDTSIEDLVFWENWNYTFVELFSAMWRKFLPASFHLNWNHCCCRFICLLAL